MRVRTILGTSNQNAWSKRIREVMDDILDEADMRSEDESGLFEADHALYATLEKLVAALKALPAEALDELPEVPAKMSSTNVEWWSGLLLKAVTGNPELRSLSKILRDVKAESDHR